MIQKIKNKYIRKSETWKYYDNGVKIKNEFTYNILNNKITMKITLYNINNEVLSYSFNFKLNDKREVKIQENKFNKLIKNKINNSNEINKEQYGEIYG